MKLLLKNYWRREDGFGGITAIVSAVVGIGATAYNLTKGTPGTGPSWASPLYGSGLPGQNAGNYGNNAPAEAINQWEHQDITLPGNNTYGSIPERTSAFGALQENTPLSMPTATASPQATTQAAIQAATISAMNNPGPLGQPTTTIGGVSVSTLEIVVLGAGVLAIGAAIFAHHKK